MRFPDASTQAARCCTAHLLQACTIQKPLGLHPATSPGYLEAPGEDFLTPALAPTCSPRQTETLPAKFLPPVLITEQQAAPLFADACIEHH